MAKFALSLVLVALAVTVQGLPSSYDDILAAVKAGNWDPVQQLINENIAANESWRKVSFGNIRNLKPPQGGKVYGEAEYTFQSSSNVNGYKTRDSAGHKVINDNGRVNEYDFQP